MAKVKKKWNYAIDKKLKKQSRSCCWDQRNRVSKKSVGGQGLSSRSASRFLVFLADSSYCKLWIIMTAERTYRCLCAIRRFSCFHHRIYSFILLVVIIIHSTQHPQSAVAASSTLSLSIVYVSMSRYCETEVKCQKAMGKAAVLCGHWVW